MSSLPSVDIYISPLIGLVEQDSLLYSHKLWFYFSTIFQIWTHYCHNCLGKYDAMNQDKVVGPILLLLVISLLHLHKSQGCIYISSFTFPSHPDQNSIFCFKFSRIIGFESQSSSLSLLHQVLALIWIYRLKCW